MGKIMILYILNFTFLHSKQSVLSVWWAHKHVRWSRTSAT